MEHRGFLVTLSDHRLIRWNPNTTHRFIPIAWLTELLKVTHRLNHWKTKITHQLIPIAWLTELLKYADRLNRWEWKRNVGLTVVYRKPILPQFFHDLSNSLKTRFKWTRREYELHMGILSSQNIVYLRFSSLGVYNWNTLKYISGFFSKIYIYI
jgi:hypothetical protein